MVALVCFFLTSLASLFKSRSRLEAENAALRHQLTVLQREVHGRVVTQRQRDTKWPLSLLKTLSIDSQSPTNQNMIVEWLQSASC